jgi:hypothetical protein
VKQDHEMSRKELVEFAKPHWVAASAIIAALAAAYSAKQGADAQAKAKRNAANASQMAQGGGGNTSFAPTATKFQDQGGSSGGRLSDVLGKASSQPATEQQQGQGLDIKTPAPITTKPAPFDNAYHVDDPTTSNAAPPVASDTAAPAATGADTAGQVGGYGQLAMQLYGLYKQSQQGPQPGQVPRAGQMNLQPTATRFGL